MGREPWDFVLRLFFCTEIRTHFGIISDASGSCFYLVVFQGVIKVKKSPERCFFFEKNPHFIGWKFAFLFNIFLLYL